MSDCSHYNDGNCKVSNKLCTCQNALNCGYDMIEKNIEVSINHFKAKIERKQKILEVDYQPLIEDGIILNEVQHTKREVLLAEISLTKLFLSHLEDILKN